jgi:Centriolar protein SAS N-terminal
MLMLGAAENPSSIRVELSSEADLFFHYQHLIDEHAYQHVQENQKLMVEVSVGCKQIIQANAKKEQICEVTFSRHVKSMHICVSISVCVHSLPTIPMCSFEC